MATPRVRGQLIELDRQENPALVKNRDELVTLSLEFMVSPAGLEQGFVYPSTTGDDSDGGTGATRDGLFCAGRKADTGLVVFGRVTNDGGIGSGCSGECATVTDLLLYAADDRSFGELAHWENISNVEGSLLATVDEGTGVETLGCYKGLFAELVTVWITEYDTGKGSATTS